MKKRVLLLLSAVCFLILAACSEYEESAIDVLNEQPIQTSELMQKEPEQEFAEPIKTVAISSAAEWNEFAEIYNSDPEKYAEYLCIEIDGVLDFCDMDFVSLADGFSGKITGNQILSEVEREEWIRTKKTWPQDYNGTFVNISGFRKTTDTAAKSMFGNVKELELENIGFANIYLDDAKSMIAESAEKLGLKNVSAADCMLPDGRAIVSVNVGEICVDKFIAESCFLTGYEYMAGIVTFVEGNAEFRDVFMCRCSFILSPDNGGSGLLGAGIGVLAKSVNGHASFDGIDIYACTTIGLYTDALANSVGVLDVCSCVLVELCSFENYSPMSSVFNSGLITSVGENRFMEMPAGEDDIVIKDCIISGEYDEAAFIARGYKVENCIFVNDK